MPRDRQAVGVLRRDLDNAAAPDLQLQPHIAPAGCDSHPDSVGFRPVDRCGTDAESRAVIEQRLLDRAAPIAGAPAPAASSEEGGGGPLDALYGLTTGLDLQKAREVSQLVRELSGYDLEPWKAVVGENLFVRESGAVASQFHDPPSIEPYSAELVSAERRIVLGKKSGLDSIRLKCDELGLAVPEDAHRELLAAVKARGLAKRGLVTDEEFRRLAAPLAAHQG